MVQKYKMYINGEWVDSVSAETFTRVNPANPNEIIGEFQKGNEEDVKKAVEDCDIVYTDTWVDMEFFLDPKFKKEKEKRIKLMIPYQVNKELLKGSDALIMHDMPIHRNYEITGEVVESPNSIIYTQSENRLYSAKGILLELLDKT